MLPILVNPLFCILICILMTFKNSCILKLSASGEKYFLVVLPVDFGHLEIPCFFICHYQLLPAICGLCILGLDAFVLFKRRLRLLCLGDGIDLALQVVADDGAELACLYEAHVVKT